MFKMKTNDGGPELKRVSNKNHVNDVKFAVQHTRWLLTLLGIWPYVVSEPSRIGRYASKLMLPLPSLLTIVFAIPILSHMILRELTRPQIIVLLAPISFRASNILKNWILVSRRHSVKYCMRHMEDDWRSLENEEDRQIMMRNVRIGHRLTMICIAAMYSSGVFYHVLMPLLRGKTLNEFNVTVKPLLFPGADIYVDLQSGYNYEIVYCSNCVGAFFLYTIVSAVVNVGAIMMSHACGQIEIIVSRLENIVGSDRQGDDRLVNNRIDFVVRCHVRVLRFVSGIDETVREMCFVEVVASTLIICLLEYYCITEWDNNSNVATITYLMLLISICFNIFIFCHIGELLTEQIVKYVLIRQCRRVGRAAYMADWYKLPGKTGLALVMIIAMANDPRKLTAGGMMELSYPSFGAIMKTSFAYLGMLRSMAE